MVAAKSIVLLMLPVTMRILTMSILGNSTRMTFAWVFVAKDSMDKNHSGSVSNCGRFISTRVPSWKTGSMAETVTIKAEVVVGCDRHAYDQTAFMLVLF